MSRPVRKQALLFLGVIAAVAVAAGLGRVLAQRTDAAPPRPVEPTAAAEGPTERGAVSAALELVTIFGSAAMYDETARSAVLERAAAEPQRSDLDRGFRLAAQTLGLRTDGTSPDGELVARVTPVGQRLEEFDGRTAVVAVWTVGLLGVAGDTSLQPVQATWSTETVTLSWREGRWQWVGVQHVDGPAPVGSAQVPAAPSSLAKHARAFREVDRAG